MFEDFKDKVPEHCQNEQKLSASLSPQVLEKLKKEGIDPDDFTLEQLFPECLDPEGNDLSLMSGAEWEIMITYAITRKYLLEKYPQSQEQARTKGQPWQEEQEPYQIDFAKAREDPQSRVYLKTLCEMKTIHANLRFEQPLYRCCVFYPYAVEMLFKTCKYTWMISPNHWSFSYWS